MKETLIDFITDIWMYMKQTKKIVISLLIALLVLMGMVVVLTEGSAFMPFIYTIF